MRRTVVLQTECSTDLYGESLSRCRGGYVPLPWSRGASRTFSNSCSLAAITKMFLAPLARRSSTGSASAGPSNRCREASPKHGGHQRIAQSAASAQHYSTIRVIMRSRRETRLVCNPGLHQAYSALRDGSTVPCFVIHQGSERTVVCVRCDGCSGWRPPESLAA